LFAFHIPKGASVRQINPCLYSARHNEQVVQSSVKTEENSVTRVSQKPKTRKKRTLLGNPPHNGTEIHH